MSILYPAASESCNQIEVSVNANHPYQITTPETVKELYASVLINEGVIDDANEIDRVDSIVDVCKYIVMENKYGSDRLDMNLR